MVKKRYARKDDDVFIEERKIRKDYLSDYMSETIDFQSLDKIDIIFLFEILKYSEDKEHYIPNSDTLENDVKRHIKEHFKLKRTPNLSNTILKLKKYGIIRSIINKDGSKSSFIIPDDKIILSKNLIDEWFKNIIDVEPYRGIINKSNEISHKFKIERDELDNEKKEIDKQKNTINKMIMEEIAKLDKTSITGRFGDKTIADAIIAYISLNERQRRRIPYILGCFDMEYYIDNNSFFRITDSTCSLHPKNPDDANIIRVLEMEKKTETNHLNHEYTYYDPKDKNMTEVLLNMCITKSYPIDFLKLINYSIILTEINKKKYEIEKNIENLGVIREKEVKLYEDLKQKVAQLLDQKEQLIQEITKPVDELVRRMSKIGQDISLIDKNIGENLKRNIEYLLNSFQPEKKYARIDILKYKSKIRLEDKDKSNIDDFFEILYPDDIDIKIEDLIIPDRIKKICKYIGLLRHIDNIEKIKNAGVSGYNKILLAGASGTGKTDFVKACAKNLDLPILLVKTNQLINMYLGETPKNVENVLKFAREKSPCIVFWDEIDDLLRDRKRQGSGSSIDEMKRALNTLLREIEKISIDDQIILFFATNLPEELDQSLNRRISQTVVFTIPSKEELKEIYIKKISSIKDKDIVDYDELANESFLFTGGNVMQVINKAYNNALLEGRNMIQSDLLFAIKEVKSGINISDLQRIQIMWKKREENALKEDEGKLRISYTS